MKISKTKAMVCATLVAAVLTGCSNDEDIAIGNNYPKDNVVRVMPSVGEAQTRSYTTETLNEFYLDILNPANSDYSYQYSVFDKYDDEWKSNSTKPLLWQNATQQVTVTACTQLKDYNSENPENICNMTDARVIIWPDQYIKSYYEMSDFLWFKDDQFIPNIKLVDGKLPISFQHGFSLLEVKVEFGTEYNISELLTASPITKLVVPDMPCNASIDFTQSPVKVSVAADADRKAISAWHGTFTAAADMNTNAIDRWSCILIPQTIAAGSFKVNILAGDATYAWTSTKEITLESGKKYQLKLTLGKDAIIVGQMTMNAWETGESGDLETE